MYQNGEKLPCDTTVSFSCVDGDYSDYEEANYSFGTEIRSGRESTSIPHTTYLEIIGTLTICEMNSPVATHIHRTNTRLAMITQFVDALTEEQIVQLYDDLIGMEGYYHVQDYNGLPGDTISETTKFVVLQSTIDFIQNRKIYCRLQLQRRATDGYFRCSNYAKRSRHFYIYGRSLRNLAGVEALR